MALPSWLGLCRDEEFASVAGFDADVGQLLGDVDGEFGIGFFAAGGARMRRNSIPGAEGAEEEAFAAVAFGRSTPMSGRAPHNGQVFTVITRSFGLATLKLRHNDGEHLPVVRRPPLMGVLRPEGDGGKRFLLCSFCSQEWEFRRILCPTCGEEADAKLPVYVAEQLPHIRVEACDTCKFFIPGIDLTKDGNAIPLVDDLAAIPSPSGPTSTATPASSPISSAPSAIQKLRNLLWRVF